VGNLEDCEAKQRISFHPDTGLRSADYLPTFSPEKTLFAHIIFRSVLDALPEQRFIGNYNSKRYTTRYLSEKQREARYWLGIDPQEEETEYPVTFEFCCEAINRCPERMRKGIAETLRNYQKLPLVPNKTIIARWAQS